MSEVFNELSRIAKRVMPAVPIAQGIMKFVPYIGAMALVSGIVDFQLPPEEITESKSNRYSSNEIFGRFEPIRVYQGSDPTQINFSFKYFWLEDSFVDSIGTWEGIHKNVKKLKAFTYPQYSMNTFSGIDGTTVSSQGQELISRLAPPPVLHFYYGEMFKDIPCIVSRVGITYRGPWNDSSLASKVQRLAAATSVSFNSEAGRKATNMVGSALKGLSTAASYVQMATGSRDGLIGAATNALQFDKIFPLETTVDISLETNYPIDTWKTYEEVAEVTGNPTAIVGKTVPNSAKGTEAASARTSAINSRTASQQTFDAYNSVPR